MLDINMPASIKLVHCIHEEIYMTEETRETRKRRREAGGYMIPAGLFIGMGIGWALGYMVQGMFIGMGAGFLAFALIILFKRD